jgi:hypothetical protein
MPGAHLQNDTATIDTELAAGDNVCHAYLRAS